MSTPKNVEFVPDEAPADAEIETALR